MEQFLTPEEWNIDNLFKGKYIIPIYQRPYNWGSQEVKQLLQDIDISYEIYKRCNMGVAGINNEEMLLFAGTLFIKNNKNVKNEYNEYDIVDGQQRITTFTLILMVLLNIMNRIDPDDDSVKDIKNYLWKKVDRKNNKESRILTLGNIDKDIMTELFDFMFSNSQKEIMSFVKTKRDSELNFVEENLLDNVETIYNHFQKFSSEKIYDYFDFIKSNIRFIAIKVQTNLVKLFSIFESINSKGKPLEQIDLIKSYIFQNLPEEYYDEYLTKWGTLITETEDNLMDYLIVYVRANVSYYRNNINFHNFKSLVESSFSEYYSSHDISDTLVKFIDDMEKNVKYYKMLKNIALLESMGLSKRAVAIFSLNKSADYIHTKALYFKMLSLLETCDLSKTTFENVIEYAFRFILTFQSICSRESKTTLGVFVDVQNEIYKVVPKCSESVDLSSEEFNGILNIFKRRIIENNINNDSLKNGIKTAITYRRNKKVAKILLSYVEYYSDDSVDYTKLLGLIKLGDYIHLDHILPQNPDRDDINFKYYVSDDNVILKDGQDFVKNTQNYVINKDEFYDRFLHVIGNLRLSWSSDNIRKSNSVIVIQDFDDSFNSYSQINQRTSDVINQIMNSKLLLSVDDIDESSIVDETAERDFIGYRENVDYKKYSPVGFKFLGDELRLDKYNYSELLEQFMRLIYDLEKEKIKSLAEEKYCPMESNRIYISTKAEDVNQRSIPLDNDVFVNKNLSSGYIIKFIYILLSRIGLDEKDLVIQLKEK